MAPEKEILAVDDVPVNLYLLRALLTPNGYRMREAASLSDARAALAERLPDLILLDIFLPDGNGLDLARELRRDSATRHIPVIAISAGTSDPREALAAGCVAFFPKPLQTGRLLETVKEILD